MASVDLTPSPSLQREEDRAQEIAECKVPILYWKEPHRGKRDLGRGKKQSSNPLIFKSSNRNNIPFLRTNIFLRNHV